MEDLSAVSDWVLMINTTPAATKMTVGAKRKCAGDDPTNEPIPTPPMPITPSSTSTTITSTGDPIGAPDQDLPKFQMPCLTPKSVQTCSIHSPDGDRKVSLKKIDPFMINGCHIIASPDVTSD
jgi:hypothetical protein